MVKVIGVRLHCRGKARYFPCGDLPLKKNDAVVLETQQGLEFGLCSNDICEIETLPETEVPERIVRLATPEDCDLFDSYVEKEKEAYAICKERIEAHDLPMRLVDVEYLFDAKRIIFYFTADGRVDFRELVKDLAAVFHTRIELRQIGVRDEARMIGGLGICGRELCCCSFLNEFQPVSIKMAKEQNLSMNPGKISGACGRLLCCLKYEQEAYEDAHRRLPNKGDRVQTAEGEGIIIDVNLLKETVLIRLTRDDEADAVTLPASEVRVIPEKCASCNKKCHSKGKKEAPSREKTAQEEPEEPQA